MNRTVIVRRGWRYQKVNQNS